MVTWGPLAFATPWALAALALLPLLWWLLKAVPPAPRRVRFPPVRFLFGLESRRRAAQTTPWWLILLRLALAAALIVAVARPVLHPSGQAPAAGDVLIVVDDGWASASDWPRRRQAAADLAALAERHGRAVALLTTAPAADAPMAAGGLLAADAAARRLAALEPVPWPVDRRAAAAALEAARDSALASVGSVFWLSDGVASEHDGRFIDALRRLGEVTAIGAGGGPSPLVLLEPDREEGRLKLAALRAGRGGERRIWVAASDADGRLLARQELTFAAGQGRAEAQLAAPARLANRIARLEIENRAAAAAVVLLDRRWQRPPVGLVAGGDIEIMQPLLSPVYFVARALEGAARPFEAPLARLMERPPAMIVLADVGTIAAAERGRLEAWLEAGGVLVRFAGPTFAQDSDDLVPVALRGRERALGGGMSWSSAQRIAPFEAASPFAGLAVPADVLIDRQVLAEPAAGLAARTWARLEDGTPLVTAVARGRGWLVLFHSSANTQWTNLPLSGLFAAMMERLVDLARSGAAPAGAKPLALLQALDGFGRLVPPAAGAGRLAADAFAAARPGPATPPGLYGADGFRQSFNLGPALPPPAPQALPDDLARMAFEDMGEIDLRPFAYGLAALLALLELYASLGLRALVPWFSARAAGAAALLLCAWAGAGEARADGEAVPGAALEVRFAHVLTGDRRVDRTAAAGLAGLGAVLASRTSIEPGAPQAVRIETDELTLYPLLYWPIDTSQATPSGVARAKLDAYLAAGGILVVDTRDADREMQGIAGTGPNAARLPEMLAGINVPALMRVQPGHALTQAYYLLSAFPGRWDGGAVWVERHPGGLNDGVSAIVVGSNDWAAAWALGEGLQPLYPVVPGGERQREMAFRFGINLAMYAVTGNYKADAVHMPTILERLGQ